jgi:transposase
VFKELIDQHFPTHGNWQGLNLGQVAIVWLSHILSQADHRMNQVQSWAEQRIESLGILVGQEVRGLDLSDDRLESVVFNLTA